MSSASAESVSRVPVDPIYASLEDVIALFKCDFCSARPLEADHALDATQEELRQKYTGSKKKKKGAEEERPLKEGEKMPISMMVRGCDHRLCAKCIKKFEPMNTGGECPVCKYPPRSLEIDELMLASMSAVRRLKKAIYGEGPGADGVNHQQPATPSLPLLEAQKFSQQVDTKGKGKKKTAPDSSSGKKKKSRSRASTASTLSTAPKESAAPSVASKREKEEYNEPSQEESDKKQSSAEKKVPRTGSKKRKSFVPRKKDDSEWASSLKVKKSADTDPEENPWPSLRSSLALTGDSEVFKRNAKGETRLHQACIKGDIEQVRRLVAKGALVNTQCNSEWSPLHEAAQRGNMEMAEFLLENNALPNVSGSDYRTPLHDAICENKFEVIKLLLKYGANIHARDMEGKTAIDLAKQSLHCDKLLEIFEDYNTYDADIQQQVDLKRARSELLNAKPKAKIKYTVYIVGCEASYLKKAKAAVENLGGKLLNRLGEDVSHIVLCQTDPLPHTDSSSSKRSTLAREGSPSFLQALLLGARIVSRDWMDACIQEEHFVLESSYEITGTVGFPSVEGPRRAIENKLLLQPKLFSGCNFYLKGTFKKPYPDANTLSEILKYAGAKILKREPNPETEERGRPFHAAIGSPLEQCSNFIIYQENLNESVQIVKYNMRHIKALPAVWLIQSMLNFKLLDPSIYTNQK